MEQFDGYLRCALKFSLLLKKLQQRHSLPSRLTAHPSTAAIIRPNASYALTTMVLGKTHSAPLRG